MSTILSQQLWNQTLADHFTDTNHLINVLKSEVVETLSKRQQYDPYRKERQLLRRLERCQTERGKLRALQRALEAERDY